MLAWPVPGRERRGHPVRSCVVYSTRKRAGVPGVVANVWHAAADVHEAAFADRGHMAVSVHQQFPGQDEEDLIAGGVDMQRRPGGSRRDSAGDDDGSAGRSAGQDDLQFAEVTAEGRAVPRDDGGHVMALFPA